MTFLRSLASASRPPGTRRRRSQAVALALLLAGALLPAPTGGQEARLLPFEIADQFDRPHTDAEIRGHIVLLAASDKHGSRHQDAWVGAIRQALRERGASGSVRIVEAADLRGVPFFVKGSVKRKFPSDPRSWVLMDWKGQLARDYRFEPQACNLLLFGRSGDLVHRVAGRELEPGALQGLVSALERALEAPPDDPPAEP